MRNIKPAHGPAQSNPHTQHPKSIAGCYFAPAHLTIPAKPKPCQRVPNGLPNSILLDPWLTTAPLPQGQPLAALIDELATSLPKARADAAKRQLAVLTCLLANFASTIIAHPLKYSITPAIAVPQGKLKATRYDNPTVTGRQLAPTLDALEAAGMIVRTPAIFKQVRTTVQPSARLVELMALQNVTASSIARLSGEEVIILRQRKARTVEGDGADQSLGNHDASEAANPAGSLIDYPDDCLEANSLRTELRNYNEFLSKSDVRIVGLDNPPPPKPWKRIFSTNGPVRFNLHGRLYAGQVGGWHQGQPKAHRHLIRINGERVAEIDFNAMHLRLAYCEAQCAPPSGDLYAIPGLEAYRPAVKIVVSAMLSITGELTKLPPSVREASADLPKQWTAKRIAQAVKEYHAPIAPLFGKDRGIAYMNMDSNILMRTLVIMMDEYSEVCLPLHDAILVRESVKDIAIAAMHKACIEMLGVALPVRQKGQSNLASLTSRLLKYANKPRSSR
jgi:hypothetical protein